MELVLDGLKLTGIGLVAVFAFLLLVVFIIELTHKAVKPFEHLLEEPAREPVKKSGTDQRMIAAAVAAAHLHKKS
mgnify:CR=1 FL=1|jgi:Na+-transporting methylmalonyl-CoA/oxaloacetate decarboxylase gamma subunit